MTSRVIKNTRDHNITVRYTGLEGEYRKTVFVPGSNDVSEYDYKSLFKEDNYNFLSLNKAKFLTYVPPKTTKTSTSSTSGDSSSAESS